MQRCSSTAAASAVRPRLQACMHAALDRPEHDSTGHIPHTRMIQPFSLGTTRCLHGSGSVTNASQPAMRAPSQYPGASPPVWHRIHRKKLERSCDKCWMNRSYTMPNDSRLLAGQARPGQARPSSGTHEWYISTWAGTPLTLLRGLPPPLLQIAHAEPPHPKWHPCTACKHMRGRRLSRWPHACTRLPLRAGRARHLRGCTLKTQAGSFELRGSRPPSPPACWQPASPQAHSPFTKHHNRRHPEYRPSNNNPHSPQAPVLCPHQLKAGALGVRQQRQPHIAGISHRAGPVRLPPVAHPQQQRGAVLKCVPVDKGGLQASLGGE